VLLPTQHAQWAGMLRAAAEPEVELRSLDVYDTVPGTGNDGAA
jgi:hypothetical protein